MRIYMVPHDPQWRHEFQDEAQRVAEALGSLVVAVHHVGSTAIPTIYAKPILDLLLVVHDITALDETQPQMKMMALGYQARGEFGIPGRRYFPRDNVECERTHQVHAFEKGSPHVARHLAFRDYLMEHPEAAQEYSSLKRKLSAEYPDDLERYCDGKDAFIKEIDKQAALWLGRRA